MYAKTALRGILTSLQKHHVCGRKQHCRDMSHSQLDVFCFPPSLPVRRLLPLVVSAWFAYKQMLQAWICLLSCLINSYLSWAQRLTVCWTHWTNWPQITDQKEFEPLITEFMVPGVTIDWQWDKGPSAVTRRHKILFHAVLVCLVDSQSLWGIMPLRFCVCSLCHFSCLYSSGVFLLLSVLSVPIRN